MALPVLTPVLIEQVAVIIISKPGRFWIKKVVMVANAFMDRPFGEFDPSQFPVSRCTILVLGDIQRFPANNSNFYQASVYMVFRDKALQKI